MSAEADEGYNDSNRAFLQAFMARSTMTFEEAKPVLSAILSVHEGREILPEDITQADLTNYISAANTAISPFDMEIRSTLHQTNQIRVYALVNTTSDPLMQLATTFSADEIAFLKRVLDAMFETNNTPRREAMVVSSMQATQLAKPPSNNSNSGDRRESQGRGGSSQGLSIREAEGMMRRLVEEGWFEKSRKGNYSLTPRALMELRTWLISTYNEVDDEDGQELDGVRNDRVKMCFACKDIITVGQRCHSRQCPGRLHDICTQTFFRMQQAQKCPICKTDWTGGDYVGEKALGGPNRPSHNNRRNGGSTQQPSGQMDGMDEGE